MRVLKKNTMNKSPYKKLCNPLYSKVDQHQLGLDPGRVVTVTVLKRNNSKSKVNIEVHRGRVRECQQCSAMHPWTDWTDTYVE